MAAAPWWKDPVTQAYNPPVEPGEDIGTPFHTPVTALLPGSVAGISYGGYGARVDVATAQGDVYYQHLDTVATGIRKGASVTAGEDIGLSGGQLYGGNLPNSILNSTGPHIEVGVVYAGRSQDPSTLIGQGPQLGLNPYTAAPGVGSAVAPGGNQPSAAGAKTAEANIAQAKQQDQSSGGLINFPNPFAGLGGWIANTTTGVSGLIAQNIIPLVVASVIILIVLGTGSGGSQAPAKPQVVPVPV